jgi:preprotein translocase subunit YajC
MISDLLVTLAQTPAPTGTPTPPNQGMQFLVMMGFMFILVYFLTIRPQKKKQQELEAQIKALKTGDKVITSSGIHGVIANVRGEGSTTLSLKISDDVKIEIEKSAIATIVREK